MPSPAPPSPGPAVSVAAAPLRNSETTFVSNNHPRRLLVLRVRNRASRGPARAHAPGRRPNSAARPIVLEAGPGRASPAAEIIAAASCPCMVTHRGPRSRASRPTSLNRAVALSGFRAGNPPPAGRFRSTDGPAGPRSGIAIQAPSDQSGQILAWGAALASRTRPRLAFPHPQACNPPVRILSVFDTRPRPSGCPPSSVPRAPPEASPEGARHRHAHRVARGPAEGRADATATAAAASAQGSADRKSSSRLIHACSL